MSYNEYIQSKNNKIPLKIECYYIQNYLYSYLKNELSEIDKKNLENHLDNCPSCKFEYESMLEFRKKLQVLISKKDIKNLFKNKKNNHKIILEFILLLIVLTVCFATFFYY